MAEAETTEQGADGSKLSLTGSVALGTGVMIGAGIFALVATLSGLTASLFADSKLYSMLGRGGRPRGSRAAWTINDSS